jgi:hypothetical protein
VATHLIRADIKKHHTTPGKDIQNQQGKRSSIHREAMGNQTHCHHLEDSTKNLENTL